MKLPSYRNSILNVKRKERHLLPLGEVKKQKGRINTTSKLNNMLGCSYIIRFILANTKLRIFRILNNQAFPSTLYRGV